MPQISVNTSTPLGYVIATLQSTINTMLTNIVSGRIIYASDVSDLVNVYNTWITHYHTAEDLRGIDTTGNLPVYGTGTYTLSTSLAVTGGSTAPVPAGVAANQPITAAGINQLVSIVNAIRSHTHDITDAVS